AVGRAVGRLSSKGTDGGGGGDSISAGEAFASSSFGGSGTSGTGVATLSLSLPFFFLPSFGSSPLSAFDLLPLASGAGASSAGGASSSFERLSMPVLARSRPS